MREIKATGPKKAQKKIPGGQEPVISIPLPTCTGLYMAFVLRVNHTIPPRCEWQVLTGLKIKKNPQVAFWRPTVEI